MALPCNLITNHILSTVDAAVVWAENLHLVPLFMVMLLNIQKPSQPYACAYTYIWFEIMLCYIIL